MSHLYPPIDPDGLVEYSVVFTDRSLNHMSREFQSVMREVSATLKQVYHAEAAVLIPGGGTYAMEAVARQFATDKKCLVIRNGWFSYRWTQIFTVGAIPKDHEVLKARPASQDPCAPFSPPPISEVLASIERGRPDLVFAPHVETSSGILLPDDYLSQVAEAVHRVGGLFVLDSIASGALWVDMVKSGVDILLSAPQKGWGATPCAGMVMLSSEAKRRISATRSTSFSCDLLKWMEIMQAYEAGGHAYHATLPTDGIATLHRSMTAMAKIGFEHLTARQRELGARVRALLASTGYRSVAAPEFAAPSVIVSYTDNDAIHKGAAFAKLGIQIAAGVPLMCDEGAAFKTFRLGLFGLDKLQEIERTVTTLNTALTQLTP